MTKLKDPIRQASLFTMAGLADPRLATDHSSQKTTGKVKNTRQSVNEFRKILGRTYGTQTDRSPGVILKDIVLVD